MQAAQTTPLPAQIHQPLREVLSQFPEIGLAVLFGSVAAGCPRADSDLDLAVAAGRPLTASTKMGLMQALAEKTGRPIDLIDLAKVEEPLLGQIVRHGKRVQGSPTEFAQWIRRHFAASVLSASAGRSHPTPKIIAITA